MGEPTSEWKSTERERKEGGRSGSAGNLICLPFHSPLPPSSTPGQENDEPSNLLRFAAERQAGK